jgi:hypothetical protein
MFYTTLNKIREHSPCCEGWRRLLTYLGKTNADDEPLSFKSILDSNGLDDAIWALRSIDAPEVRLFAVRCVRQIQHLISDERSLNALDVSEDYAVGEATKDELSAAWDAAGDAAGYAAEAAAEAAARAEARYAARDAARYVQQNDFIAIFCSDDAYPCRSPEKSGLFHRDWEHSSTPTKKDTMSTLSPFIGQEVIVRTYSAGVFYGKLENMDGQEAVVTNARRVWYWAGAASLSQLSKDGTSNPDDCKFPAPVDAVHLTQVIEVLPLTEKAKLSLDEVKVWRE